MQKFPTGRKSAINPALTFVKLVYLMRSAKQRRKPMRRTNSNMITVDLKSKQKLHS